MEKEPNNPQRKQFYNTMKAGVEWYKAQKKSSVYIKSYDGLKLYGELIKAKEQNDKIIILFHGYRSLARNDFCCAMPYYNSLGIDILLVDQRAHGKSEGGLITFGVKERNDVVSWVKYVEALSSDYKKIFLSGMSMGASTVMMASNLVDGVSGIIADCGFTSPKEIIQIVAKKRFRLPKWFASPVGLCAKIFGGFDYSYSTKTALAESKAPVLFIHGSKDDFVPSYMTDINFDTCSSKKHKIIASEAPHGYSFLYATDEIKGAIKNLIFNN
ncbi:MAG: alpha/beta hydrolase [Clostridia bacterium]|nr:alpha/beta hydrolase [Clostridia bacterium]